MAVPQGKVCHPGLGGGEVWLWLSLLTLLVLGVLK